MNVKSKRMLTIPFVLVVGSLAGVGALGQDSPTKIKGEVIQVMQQTRAGEAGTLDAVMVRTRQGVQMRLVLGRPGSCQGCVQVGDRVRVRLSKNGSSPDGHPVRSMKVHRTGDRTRFRGASGDLVQARSRDRTADGTALQGRSRNRIQQPGRGTGNRLQVGRGGGGGRRG